MSTASGISDLPAGVRAAGAVVRRVVAVSPTIGEAAAYRLNELLAPRIGHRTARLCLRSGAVVVVDLADHGMRRTALLGEYEPDLQTFAACVIEPGDIAIDVGANVGLHALQLAVLVGPDGLVHALEPAPGPRQLLEAGVHENRFESRMRIHAAAGGAKDGRAMLWLDSGAGLASSTMKDWGASDVGIHVDVVALDDLLAIDESRSLALIKIDVEGAEAVVIDGAASLIKARRPRAIIVEVSSFDASTKVVKSVTDCGYVAVLPQGGRLVPDTASLPARNGAGFADPSFDYRNVFLIRAEDAERTAGENVRAWPRWR